MKLIKKLIGVVLALAMIQGVAFASIAVSSPVSAAASTQSKTFYFTMGVGQTRYFSEAVYIPCRATYYTGSSCLQVDSKGAIKAVKVGSGIAFAYGDNGITYLIHTKVVAAPDKVTLSNKKATMAEGDKFNLSATISPTKVDSADMRYFVTWTSSNTMVAKVTPKGNVTCLKRGTVTITARTYNGKTASCDVTIKTAHDYYVDEVLRIVNIERKKGGLSPVTKDATLCKFADTRAYEISDKDANGVDYFAHARRDGRVWYTILDDVDYDYTKGGENIAAGYKTAERVMQGWMDSEGHRENIMNPAFKKIGIGYYYNADSPYKIFATQIFTN